MSRVALSFPRNVSEVHVRLSFPRLWSSFPRFCSLSDDSVSTFHHLLSSREKSMCGHSMGMLATAGALFPDREADTPINTSFHTAILVPRASQAVNYRGTERVYFDTGLFTSPRVLTVWSSPGFFPLARLFFLFPFRSPAFVHSGVCCRRL